MLILTLGLAAACAHAQPLPASDWITTGTDCKVFAAADVTGDGFPDLITINGNKDLCVAPSVNGWKSAGWRALSSGIAPDAVAIWFTGAGAERRVTVIEPGRAVIVPLSPEGKAGPHAIVPAPESVTFRASQAVPAGVIEDGSGGFWRLTDRHEFVRCEHTVPGVQPFPMPHVSPPPYDPGAGEVCRFTSACSGGVGTLAWQVFASDKPHAHHVVRVAVFEGADPADDDADGLTDDEEVALKSDPHDRDTDDDGLLDGWEVHGFPADRASDLGPRIGLFGSADRGPDSCLCPVRQDVIVNISYFEQVDKAAFEGELAQVQRAYREVNSKNPDGTTGIWVHFRDHREVVAKADQSMPWWDVGNKYFPKRERGLMHWMQVTPWGGGQSSQTGDMGGAGNNWAVFAHEFGHQMSLSHEGDSRPAWCPLYPSMMNYAYSYSFDGGKGRPHFSSGEFREVVLDEKRLKEELPFSADRVGFLAQPPFRFTIAAKGENATQIDWNHNGQFDDRLVEADINYGGSTSAGHRRTHTLIGSAPSLANIAGRCVIAASTHKQTAVTLKASMADEEWTSVEEVASSSSRADPVLVGCGDFGVVLVRRFEGWTAAKVTLAEDLAAAPKAGALQALAGLDEVDVACVFVEGRVLVIARHDDGSLEARWLSVGEKFELGPAQSLGVTSAVAPGLAVNPADGSILMVGAATHEKHGPFRMRTCVLRVEEDSIVEAEPEWTHDGSPSHCTSRPVPVWRGTGNGHQLIIFHTGWADGNGCWTGWRTMRIGNTALSGGWLTSQLYDEWTRSRVALGFADTADGAFYAFRWDPGDHNDWKINTMFVAKGGYGIDDAPMRDFDDGAKMSLWGIRHSILTMPTDEEVRE